MKVRITGIATSDKSGVGDELEFYTAMIYAETYEDELLFRFIKQNPHLLRIAVGSVKGEWRHK